MTRDEHLEWAKKRALEFLDSGDVENAVASMASDLQKHPETANSAEVGGMILLTCRTRHDIRRWIEGFR